MESLKLVPSDLTFRTNGGRSSDAEFGCSPFNIWIFTSEMFMEAERETFASSVDMDISLPVTQLSRKC